MRIYKDGKTEFSERGLALKGLVKIETLLEQVFVRLLT